MSRVLVIDNYDSFTFNLVHLLRELGSEDPVVLRNDKLSVEDAAAFPNIVLSPGPGIPLEAGVMPQVVRELSSSHRILGVCLGHQCIGEVFGGTLINLEKPFHGVSVETKVVDEQEQLFSRLPDRFMTGRYHSWVVASKDFPSDLQVTAVDGDGHIMALRHKQFDVRGVQFHPESILTNHGREMIENWLSLRK